MNAPEGAALETIVPGADAARAPTPRDTEARARSDDAATWRTASSAGGRGARHPDELRSMRSVGPRWPLLIMLTVAALAGLWLMVPKRQDLATVQARAPARMADLEAAVDRGDRSSSTLTALAREALRTGDVPRATQVLGDVLRRQPNDPEALQMLVQTHDRAQRSREAVAALESLQRVAPTLERQRDIVQRYSTLGDERQTLTALTKLVGSMPGADTAEHRRLAGLLISGGAPRAALETLDALARLSPGRVDAELASLRMRALLAIPAADAQPGLPSAAATSAGVDAAAQVVAQWIKAKPPGADADVLTLVQPLARAGQHERIVALLEPHLSSQEPNLLAAWTEAMRNAQRSEQAAQRLATLPGPAGNHALLTQRVGLALDLGRMRDAADALRRHGWARVDGALLLRFVQGLLATRASPERDGWLRELWTAGGQSALSRANPVAAARVALAVGDHTSASKLADASLAHCEGAVDCAVRVAVINHVQGRDLDVAAALKVAHDGGVIDENLLLDYARTAMAHGQAGPALAKLNAQRRAPTSMAYNEAWAMVATQQGQHADVERWLESMAGVPINDSLLRDLFKLAVDAKANTLSVMLGVRLGNKLKLADRVMVAQALGEMGRVQEALIVWKGVRAESKAYEDAYARSLEQVAKRRAAAGAPADTTLVQASQPATAPSAMTVDPAQAALATVLVERLKASKPGTDRQALVQQLVDLQAHDLALPWLETLALAEPLRWMDALEVAAVSANRRDKLLPVWRKAVMVDAIPRLKRLQIAQNLVQAGDVEHGDFAQRMMLTDKPLDDPEVQRLFARWGERLTSDQLDWVQARALSQEDRSASRAAWLRKLNDGGGAKRTVALVSRYNPALAEGPVFEAYVDALNKLGDRAALARVLARSATAPATGGQSAR
jgi:hypothetical protein